MSALIMGESRESLEQGQGHQGPKQGHVSPSAPEIESNLVPPKQLPKPSIFRAGLTLQKINELLCLNVSKHIKWRMEELGSIEAVAEEMQCSPKQVRRYLTGKVGQKGTGPTKNS
jgi:hypothetical protein